MDNSAARDERYYIGLMSGTSIDGTDGVIIAIRPDMSIRTVCAAEISWPEETAELLTELCRDGSARDNVHDAAVASCKVAERSAELCRLLLKKSGLKAEEITAVGSHGQTVRHRPEYGFSVQLDNGPLLAALTGIDVVVNFRAADIACGGQGAPLAQAFHQLIFSSPHADRFVLNLGGIANVSALAAGTKDTLVTAFDTGPANTLIDAVCRGYLNIPFDRDGILSASGCCDSQALSRLMTHPYLSQPFPKSTGRETFNEKCISFMTDGLNELKEEDRKKKICDILATLTDFTALSAVRSIEHIMREFKSSFTSDRKELIVCGGGALNPVIFSRLEYFASKIGLTVHSSAEFGADPKLIEAEAFACFAHCCVSGISLPLGSSTGAQKTSVAGCLCPAANGSYVRSMHRF